MVLERAADHGCELRALHAHGRQARGQAQAGVHVAYGFGNVAARVQAHGVGHALQALFGAHALGLGIEAHRSEEHTSELQSPCNIVCRLLLEKKKAHLTTLSITAVKDQPLFTTCLPPSLWLSAQSISVS